MLIRRIITEDNVNSIQNTIYHILKGLDELEQVHRHISSAISRSYSVRTVGGKEYNIHIEVEEI